MIHSSSLCRKTILHIIGFGFVSINIQVGNFSGVQSDANVENMKEIGSLSQKHRASQVCVCMLQLSMTSCHGTQHFSKARDSTGPPFVKLSWNLKNHAGVCASHMCKSIAWFCSVHRIRLYVGCSFGWKTPFFARKNKPLTVKGAGGCNLLKGMIPWLGFFIPSLTS